MNASQASDSGMLQLARRLAGAGRYGDARNILQGLLNRSPGDIDAITLMAQIAIHDGQLDAAAEAIDLAARLAPELAAVQYTRGRLLKMRGDLPQAIECYRRAVEASP